MPDPVKIFEKEILALETKFYNDIAKILGRLEGASTTAIIQALQDFRGTPPMVIRLAGTRDNEGSALLNKDGINTYQDVMEAVKKVKEVLAE